MRRLTSWGGVKQCKISAAGVARVILVTQGTLVTLVFCNASSEMTQGTYVTGVTSLTRSRIPGGASPQLVNPTKLPYKVGFRADW
jgi:hypothetical protein